MSRLEELIRAFCPEGVMYNEIGMIAEVGTGSSNGNEANDNGVYPFYVRSQTVKLKDDYEYDEEAIIIPGEGGIGDIFHYVNGKYALHQRVYRIHFISDSVDTKFAYYYMSAYFKSFITRKAVNATVTSIRKPMIQKFRIPIPPLAVQQEIVRILDSFTALTAELAAELTARRKQYEYYRDELLTFGDDVQWETIGAVCKLSAGGDVPKERFSKVKTDEYNIPIFSNGIGENAIYGYTDIPKVKAPCVTVAARGTIGYCELRKEDFYPVVRLICVCPKAGLLPTYLKYYLETVKFQVPTSGIPQLTVPMLSKYRIPIPSISMQEEIVSLLDGFSKICNDISSGLPAEIAARQKQYEYYRDKLLTFEELET